MGDGGGLKGLQYAGANLVNINAGNLNGSEAIGESPEVFFEGKNFAFIALHYLINAISEVNSAVQISRVEFFGGDDGVFNHS
jgi:hypothetical protein